MERSRELKEMHRSKKTAKPWCNEWSARSLLSHTSVQLILLFASSTAVLLSTLLFFVNRFEIILLEEIELNI